MAWLEGDAPAALGGFSLRRITWRKDATNATEVQRELDLPSPGLAGECLLRACHPLLDAVERA